MTIRIERETNTECIERCDHEGTAEPPAGLSSVLAGSACGKICPTRFRKGGPTGAYRSKATRVSRD